MHRWQRSPPSACACPFLVQVPQLDIKLIVLDSIAALLRTEFGGGEAAALAARGEMLGQQAALLKAVAEANRIPVVVTNQVWAT